MILEVALASNTATIGGHIIIDDLKGMTSLSSALSKDRRLTWSMTRLMATKEAAIKGESTRIIFQNPV